MERISFVVSARRTSGEAGSARCTMADAGMAAHAAIRLVGKLAVLSKMIDDIVMTVDAIPQEDAGVLRLDADRVGKILKRERLRVEEAVLGLGDVLADEVVGEMAVDADGVAVVTCLLPGVECLAH